MTDINNICDVGHQEFMVYFFYGEDDFRLKRKISSVAAEYQAKHKSGFNFGYFDLAQEGEWEKLKNFFDSYSMFAEKKLAVVKDLFDVGKDIKEMKIDIKDIKEDVHKLDKRVSIVEHRVGIIESEISFIKSKI